LKALLEAVQNTPSGEKVILPPMPASNGMQTKDMNKLKELLPRFEEL